jgi:cytochrome c556
MKKFAAVTAVLALVGTAAAIAQQAAPPAPPAAPAAAAPAPPPPPDSEARAARRAVMRSTQQTVTQINEIVIGVMDPAGLKTRLQTLTENAQKTAALFAPGTDRNDAGAKPEIWTDPAGFKAANDKFIADIQKVVVAIPDRVKLAEAMRDLQSNCAGCHTKYRVMPAVDPNAAGRGRGRGGAAAAAAAPAQGVTPAAAAPPAPAN